MGFPIRRAPCDLIIPWVEPNLGFPVMPLVSVITPTANRAAMLRLVHECVLRQDHAELEWLLLDDGDAPVEFLAKSDDPRIRYVFTSEKLSVGEKRNRLIAEAKGEVIAQFDDDDYYSPNYITTMIGLMRKDKSDLVKLSAFFLYHTLLDKFAFWDLNDRRGHHFVWGSRVASCTIFSDENDRDIRNVRLNYGFSYVYLRSLWERVRFEDLGFGEDGNFIESAIQAGRPCALVDDKMGLCVHVLHRHNSSRCFPQYLVPEFVARRYFPGFDKAAYADPSRVPIA